MPTARTSTSSAPPDPMASVRSCADALYRAAIECCRQRERAAKQAGSEEPELEHRHLDAICKMCDGSLAELSDAYTAAAANVHPEGDEAWWHKSNSLWHAAREYGRHHAGCDAMGKRVSGRHDAVTLANMQLEYELEASALLALRHAAEAYLKTRPGLT